MILRCIMMIDSSCVALNCVFSHLTFELCVMLYYKVFLLMVTMFCTELKSLMYWDVLQLCCTKSQNQIHCTFTLSCWLQHTALLHCNLHYTTLHWNGFSPSPSLSSLQNSQPVARPPITHLSHPQMLWWSQGGWGSWWKNVSKVVTSNKICNM